MQLTSKLPALTPIDHADTADQTAASTAVREPPVLSANVGERRRARWPGTTLKLLVSLALIAWLLRDVSGVEVLASLSQVRIEFVAAALGLNFVGYIISVTRWRVLLSAQGVAIPFGFLVRSFLVAVFFTNLLPSTVGGDAVRAYDTWRFGRNGPAAVTAVLLDRLSGAIVLVLFALAAAAIFNTMHLQLPVPAAVLAALAVLVMGVAWFLLRSPERVTALIRKRGGATSGRLRQAFERLVEALGSLRHQKCALLAALLLAALLQTNVVIHYFLLGRAVGFDIPVGNYFLIVPLALAVMAIPVSINAIGLRETSFTFLLGLYGVGRSDALAFAWTAYLLMLGQSVLGGLVYAVRRETPSR